MGQTRRPKIPKFAPFGAVRAIRDVPELYVHKGDVLFVLEEGARVRGTFYYACDMPEGTDSPIGVEYVPEDALEKYDDTA